jgi:hypothetical protein
VLTFSTSVYILFWSQFIFLLWVFVF